MSKTLVLAVDVGNTKNEWEVTAMKMQISDYFKKNKILPADDVILFPIKGEMKIFWLEGNPNSLSDVKDLEEIKDKLKPVLGAAMGLWKDKKVKLP